MKEYEVSIVEAQDENSSRNTENNESSSNTLHRMDQDFSFFDRILLAEWKKAMRGGACKFKLDSPLPTRHLDGKYKLIVQVFACYCLFHSLFSIFFFKYKC